MSGCRALALRSLKEEEVLAHVVWFPLPWGHVLGGRTQYIDCAVMGGKLAPFGRVRDCALAATR